MLKFGLGQNYITRDKRCKKYSDFEYYNKLGLKITLFQFLYKIRTI